MSEPKDSHDQKSKSSPKDAPAPPPAKPSEPEKTEPSGSAREQAEKAAKEGHPDPLAQIKISGEAGALGGASSLTTELGKLPAIPALDSLKANAASGYYGTVPAKELADALRALPLDAASEDARAHRDALVKRAEAGAFGGGR